MGKKLFHPWKWACLHINRANAADAVQFTELVREGFYAPQRGIREAFEYVIAGSAQHLTNKVSDKIQDMDEMIRRRNASGGGDEKRADGDARREEDRKISTERWKTRARTRIEEYLIHAISMRCEDYDAQRGRRRQTTKQEERRDDGNNQGGQAQFGDVRRPSLRWQPCPGVVVVLHLQVDIGEGVPSKACEYGVVAIQDRWWRKRKCGSSEITREPSSATQTPVSASTNPLQLSGVVKLSNSPDNAWRASAPGVSFSPLQRSLSETLIIVVDLVPYGCWIPLRNENLCQLSIWGYGNTFYLLYESIIMGMESTAVGAVRWRAEWDKRCRGR
ncbi:hypothetical protein C8R44DRAFT_750316 [Mycena epipterygia]|nr:hypothetical protein C8R44DRAFT_750316 [Mycena epipterygia]